MTKIKILSDKEIDNLLDNIYKSRTQKKRSRVRSSSRNQKQSQTKRASLQNNKRNKIRMLKKQVKLLESEIFKLLDNQKSKGKGKYSKKNISLKKGLMMIEKELRKSKKSKIKN